MKKTILLALLTTFASNALFAQPNNSLPVPVKKIEVTGIAEMEVVPDEIYIGITLQEYYNKQKVKIIKQENGKKIKIIHLLKQ